MHNTKVKRFTFERRDEMSKYSMGIDFGTLSCRAILLNLDTGMEETQAVSEYKHGVISEQFINGEKLPPDYALQHPQDYLDALKETVGKVIKNSGVDIDEIVGVGVDFTASTIIPVKADGTPLCFDEKFRLRPHSYAKLWKHHAAQKEADEITKAAQNEEWLKRYGGTISSEWMFPKIWQILKEDEEVYNSTARFVEAADWIVWQLTGEETHSVCTTGFKGMWNEKDGYPSMEFFGKLDSRLMNIVGDKVSENVVQMSQAAGKISNEAGKILGLKEGTPVSPGIIDAHAALPALGVSSSGQLLMIIGTSTCHILISDKETFVPGISGVVKDGIFDGCYAYEAGQACVGDSFDWFIKNCVSEEYFKEAHKKGVNIFTLMDEKAQKLAVGENGVIVLDWWNGNRTPYVDSNLSGMILGLTLTTKPEDIYRGIIESTAFGTKAILDLYNENGISTDEIYAAGGISQKNEFLIQVYADVIGKKIKVASSTQAGAKGSAMFAAVAGGYFSDMNEAVKKLADKYGKVYYPNPENTRKYEKLYNEYKKLCQYFGSENNVMKKIREV